MPALRYCGKRLNTAGDDLVFSSALKICIRVIWLVSGVILYTIVPVAFECAEEDEQTFVLLLNLLWGAWMVNQLILIGITTAIMSVSARGTIFESHKRKHLFPLVLFRDCSVGVEALVAVFGVIISASNDIYLDKSDGVCEAIETSLTVIRVFVAISWLFVIGFIIQSLFYFDLCNIFSGPGNLEDIVVDDDHLERCKSLLYVNSVRQGTTGGSDEQKDVTTASITSNYYKKRRERATRRRLSTQRMFYTQQLEQNYYTQKFKRLLWCCCREDDSVLTGFKDMSTALSIMFHNKDYTISDLLAGLLLLFRQQKVQGYYERELQHMRKWTISSIENDPSQHIPGYVYESPRPLDFSNPNERAMFTEGHYYLNYALGMYGWQIYVYLNLSCGICQLLGRAKCRRTNHRASVDIHHDNCLMTNTAALRLEAGIDERHILYANYEDGFYRVPFSVTFDQTKRNIVLSIRGTMSLKDALTDVTFSRKRMDIDKEPYSDLKTFCHFGLYQAAEHIMEEMEANNILATAFSNYPSYGLVVCGHSLGAGIAAVLSVMLKEDYPDLKCYCFSPVGGTFSFPLMEYSKSFITTFLIGNDTIGRITIRSLIHLSDAMTMRMENAPYPKYQIMLGTLGELINRGLKCECLLGKESETISIATVTHTVYLATKYFKKWYAISKAGRVHQLRNFLKSQEKVPLFPPGRMIHIQSNEDSKSGSCCEGDPEMEVNLVANEDFSVIRLGKNMLLDHVPGAVKGAFGKAYMQYIQSSESSREITSYSAKFLESNV